MERGGGDYNLDAAMKLKFYVRLPYSVMQSDRNSFGGDVVLDSFNMSYRDEDSILDQKYEKQISWDL